MQISLYFVIPNNNIMWEELWYVHYRNFTNPPFLNTLYVASQLTSMSHHIPWLDSCFPPVQPLSALHTICPIILVQMCFLGKYNSYFCFVNSGCTCHAHASCLYCPYQPCYVPSQYFHPPTPSPPWAPPPTSLPPSDLCLSSLNAQYAKPLYMNQMLAQ